MDRRRRELERKAVLGETEELIAFREQHHLCPECGSFKLRLDEAEVEPMWDCLGCGIFFTKWEVQPPDCYYWLSLDEMDKRGLKQADCKCAKCAKEST